jgi:hypothetical protein
MKIFQNETHFQDVNIILERKEEANALREIIDFFTYDMVENGTISSEAYFLSVRLSDAFTDCVIEVPLDRDEKDIAIGGFDG